MKIPQCRVFTGGLISAAALSWAASATAAPTTTKPAAKSTAAVSSAVPDSSRQMLAANAKVPGVAVGWPQIVSGSVTGTPVAADLDGDGTLEIVAPVMHRRGNVLHPNPTLAAQMWALRVDGSVMPQWPVTLRSEESRKADREKNPGLADNWFSSPSVCDIEGDGTEEIVTVIGGQSQRGTRLLYGDGGKLPISNEGDGWATVPLSDLDGDGIPDMVIGEVVASANGQPVQTWPEAKRPRMAYGGIIGDANNDGQPEVYVPSYEKSWHLTGAPDNKTVTGYDRSGNVLPGWPQKMPSLAIYVVMGDVTGDNNKEVVAVDTSGMLHVWTWDGKVVWESQSGGGTFFSGWSPPSLADMDGDGQAEIIVMNGRNQMLHILHGDGTPWRTDSVAVQEAAPTIKLRIRDRETGKLRYLDPANPDDKVVLDSIQSSQAQQTRAQMNTGDGAVLKISGASRFGSIAVVDLGGDDVMDLFIGSRWIRLPKSGPGQMVSMLPDDETTTSTTGSSVVDLDGDGKSEVLFGTDDGRLYVYRTDLSLPPTALQWRTQGGNFQHTGVWNDPRKTTAKS